MSNNIDVTNKPKGVILTILIHKTHVVLRTDSYYVTTILDIVCEKLTIYKYIWNPRTKRNIREKDKGYFALNRELGEYRFPITIFKDILLTLGSNGLKRDVIAVEYVEPVEGYPIDFKWNDKYVARDYQNDYVNTVIDNGMTIALVDLHTGGGKLQGNSQPVKTDKGWVNIGDIKVGDNVLTQDGTYTKVTGVYPQGIKEQYKFTFYDGRTSRAGKEHLWKVFNPDWYKPNKGMDGWKVVTTEYLYGIYKNLIPRKDNNNIRWYVPLIEPEIGEKKKYFIDPYLMGVILGDASLSSGHPIVIHTQVKDILDKLDTKLQSGYKLNRYIRKEPSGVNIYEKSTICMEKDTRKGNGVNMYTEEIKRLGLDGCTSLTKFIPREYLDGSEEQRWELLRGLMDTDGNVEITRGRNGKYSKSGSLKYSTSSPKLKDGIVELVRSLGGMATVGIKIPTYTWKGEKKKGNISYRISIRLKHPSMAVTRLHKRAERVGYTNQYSKNFKLRINSIVPDGEEESTCISVEHPSKLYVTQDYVVTHNTFIAMRILWNFKQRTAVLVLPKYVDKWIADIKEYSNVTDEDIYIVQGGGSLEKLCHMDADEMKYKFIVFSMVTVTNYINDYEEGKLALDVPSPDKLMEKLKIGILFNDETHQHFHALFKATLYFNVNRILGMTATLVSNRPEINKMYNMLFPPKYRISNLVKHEPYVNVEAVQYELNTWRKVRYQTVQGYSHVTYEDYIMSHNLFLNSYLELIEEFFKKRYINNRTPGDRCLIYCSTIRMCTIVANYLKERYKDLSIGTYVESDSYESIMSNDVSVSTLGSASTGLDIKGLITVINTISVTSMQSNLQSLGRLRKIEGKELWYVYLYCKNIPKQIKMHKDRKVAIEKTVKSYIYTTYYKTLKVR